MDDDAYVYVPDALGRMRRRRLRYLNGDGYVVTWRRGRKELEHRVVAEEKLGRHLAPGEHVHHLNRDRTDNRPENLEVLSHDDHSRQHNGSCGESCGCAKHSPYVRDEVHRALQSERMRAYWRRRRGEQ